MDAHRRMPLHDLPLEQFLSSTTNTANKAPRKHKRPLSPSRTTPLNPAKRRVLDAQGVSHATNTVSTSSRPPPFMLSNMHVVTSTRPSQLGNGTTRNPQATSSLLSSRRRSPSREYYAKPIVESSVDPQSRHYPGFDIFQDGERRQGSPVPIVPLLSGDAQVDKVEEDKENVPLKRKAKKPCPKKRLLSSFEGLDTSHLCTLSKVVRPDRTPFSVCQAPR